jgi:hypothetical protein
VNARHSGAVACAGDGAESTRSECGSTFIAKVVRGGERHLAAAVLAGPCLTPTLDRDDTPS